MKLLHKYTLTISFFFLIMMSLMAYVIIKNVQSQLAENYQNRLEASSKALSLDLEFKTKKLSHQLNAFGKTVVDNTDFLLLSGNPAAVNQRTIIRFAENHMRLMGLDYLEILDNKGIVLSSGNFPSSFGNSQRSALRRLKRIKNTPVLLQYSSIRSSITALTVIDSVNNGSQKFYILGGSAISSAFLNDLVGDIDGKLHFSINDSVLFTSSDNDTSLLKSVIIEKDGILQTEDEKYAIALTTVTLIVGDDTQKASFYLYYPRASFLALAEQLSNSVISVMGIGLLLAVLISILLTMRTARALTRLTQKAESLSLETLDIDFDINRKDEVGILNTSLANMQQRLRQNRVDLSLAEQKSSFADIARQVNHDIKNGFLPIRNIMQHWDDVSKNTPDQLLTFFNERKRNIFDSIAYLEDLAKRYSKLKPQDNITKIDLNEMLIQLLKNYQVYETHNISFTSNFTAQKPLIRADIVQLRRAFENILRNAIEAMPTGGSISVETQIDDTDAIIIITDSGSGIDQSILEHLFITPVSTKAEGSGIGLANVKRIIDALGGRIKISNGEIKGTIVKITIPLSGNIS